MMLITRNDDAGSCDDADNDTDGGDHVGWYALENPYFSAQFDGPNY